MKLRSLLLAGIFSVSAATASACQFCFGNYNHKHAKTTTADAGEDDYDIRHLRFNLNVTDTSIYIQGDVTTTAQVTAASMSEYVFELGTTMIIDSAKFNGAPATVSTSGIVRKITAPSPLPAGTMFSAQIFYHGMPPAGGGFFNGVTHAISSHGTHMVYTVSDPWVALNWWPVKQSVNDQADSVDMFVTVPAGVTDASNGLLLSVDNTTLPGYSTFHWQTKYPIDYYLISIAVARYAEYKSYMHFTGSTDSMLVQNFLMDTTTFNPLYKANFDSVGYTIDYFSQLYGRYPFWHEKYGMSFTNLGGGMEHQTMTTIGVTGTSTIAHELAHQWFGDNVTYKTWGDMWLSEGFATFSEQLFFEHFWSANKAKATRVSWLNSQIFSQPCGMTYVNDTSTSDSLFTINQYPKAAMIISTLRYMAPDDNTFFHMLRTYQSTYGGQNASTADFKAIAEAEYGTNLDTFFNQWIYGRGYPMYRVNWNQSEGTVWVKLMQSQSCPSYTKHFSTPVEVTLHSASADTIIKVYNSADTQVFSFHWPATVTAVYINNDAVTLLKVLSVSKDATLGIGAVTPDKIRIHPNPSKNYWEVEELPEDTALVLVDMTGKVIWQGNSDKGNATIPGERLPTGNYVLRIAGNSEASVKLVHW